MKHDSTARGTWGGQRVKLPPDRAVSSAVVSLYEYRDKNTGLWFYSVDSELGTDILKRSEKPICRVWKNPSSLVLLDYKAKPVPYVRSPR